MYTECPLQAFPEILVEYTDASLPTKCSLCVIEQSMPDSSDVVQLGFDETSGEGGKELMLRIEEAEPFVYDVAIGTRSYNFDGSRIMNCTKRLLVHCVNDQPPLF